jgi:dTDP-4-amino-4,6-dideoxygalactose transaminase
MKIPFVDLKLQYQSVKSEMDKTISGIIDNTAFIGGKALSDFNDNFAKFIDSNHAIGVGNGTDAIIIALKALAISTGDEVIVPANSFIATSEAVTAAGGKVVFVDCHPDTYTIDTSKIEDKVTNRTKVIIPVHLYGQPADMGPILKIAEKYNLKVLEDSAQAHGAKYRNRNIGTIGDIATFSFYPGKNLGAYGDGGAIVTNNDNLARLCKMYANHGRIDKYNHEFEGINSRLDGLQAAVLNVKLKYIDTWNEQRRNVASLYRKNLSGIENILLPTELGNTLPVYHLFVIRTKKRDELQQYLKESGISTGVHYPIGLPFLNAYKYLNHKPEDFPITYQYQYEILSLPIFPEMTEAMVEYVSQKIKNFFR